MILLLTACSLFINPTEGTYDANVRNLDADSSCEDTWGLDVDALRDINATEVELSKDGDSMELDDEIECDLDGVSFDCFRRLEEDVEDYDATIETSIEITGDWTSSTSFESDWSMEVSCSGSSCGDLSDSCIVTWTIEGELDD
ncbi:MAG: hypothetical protein V4850_31635 [Myxococcota bacterium]